MTGADVTSAAFSTVLARPWRSLSSWRNAPTAPTANARQTAAQSRSEARPRRGQQRPSSPPGARCARGPDTRPPKRGDESGTDRPALRAVRHGSLGRIGNAVRRSLPERPMLMVAPDLPRPRRGRKDARAHSVSSGRAGGDPCVVNCPEGAPFSNKTAAVVKPGGATHPVRRERRDRASFPGGGPPTRPPSTAAGQGPAGRNPPIAL